MGLIKAIIGAAGGTLADQWKEFFYCDALPADILVKKGSKRTGGRSSNTSGEDNVISNGSIIAVADGQCMIIVEQGRVVDFCAEPGEFRYDQSTEPSLFAGSLGEGLKNTFKTIARRFTFGGDAGKDQRVYYFNTKPILGNKFGTPTPIPFLICIPEINFKRDLRIRVSGVFSYRITDPLLFYTNVCANVADEYTRKELDEQIKPEFIGKLRTGIGKISRFNIRESQIVEHEEDLKAAMNEELSAEWGERGIKVETIAIQSSDLTPEGQEIVEKAQDSVFNAGGDPRMAGIGRMIVDTGAAARLAANNSGGAMVGMAGMGMAMNNMGNIAAGLGSMGAMFQQAQPPAGDQQFGGAAFQTPGAPQQAQPQPQASAAPSAGEWKCSCGAVVSGKFCTACGKPKPAEEGWTCECGAVNKGKFCPNCGKPKPAAAPLYRCDKCGWTPPDPKNPPKFCPECGDRFDENDAH